MVLLSFLLVLAAAVTLVIGLVGTGLGLIYLSIACSLAAGIVLAIAVVRSRPSTELATAGPAPLPSNEPHSFTSAPGTSVLDRDDTGRDDSLDVGERIRVFADPEPAPAAERDDTGVDDDASIVEVDVEPAGEDVFAPAAVEPEPEAEPEPVPSIATAGAATTSWAVRDDDWGGDDDADFPIADYDSLRVSQIVPLLPELDPDELEIVREREVDVKGGRVSILNRIDALLGRTAMPPAPVKKAAAKKAPAKKAAATKKAGGAGSTAKKAPARKAAAKATPSVADAAEAAPEPAAPAPSKAAAKKAPAKKAAAKKAAAKKPAAPAKKAAKKQA